MVTSVLPPAPAPLAPQDLPAGGRLRQSQRLSLRLRVHLIVASLMTLFVVAMLWLLVDDTRRSVREEISGGNRVATQLLQRVSWIYQRSGPEGLREFLAQLGRVRANDIILFDTAGAELYHSPPSPYKAGRSAPDWYSHLVAPPPQRQEISFPGGRLVVEADPSRAILDGWDDLARVAGMALLALLLLNLGVFWLVGRTLAPLARIEQVLARIEAGDWTSRLPPLPGREAARMGLAVNRMADALQGRLDEQKRAWAAERSLDESRALAWQIEQHMEAERREIARELHDELGQSVTAIRSLAASLVQRLPDLAAPAAAVASGTAGIDAAAQAARRQDRELAALIGAEAGRLDHAMHGLIPRLAPLSLDAAGLADALADLVAGAAMREPARHIHLDLGELAGLPGELPDALTLTAYRVAQEGLNNALKHSGAARIDLALRWVDDRLVVAVQDDGRGPPAGGLEAPTGRYGLRGLRERVRALGGALTIEAVQPRGCRLLAQLPLEGVPPEGLPLNGLPMEGPSA